MVFLDKDHKEWGSMWRELAQYPLNDGDSVCLHQGAKWEYMGSSLDHHNFRHSKHPLSGAIEHVYVERSCAPERPNSALTNHA